MRPVKRRPARKGSRKKPKKKPTIEVKKRKKSLLGEIIEDHDEYDRTRSK